LGEKQAASLAADNQYLYVRATPHPNSQTLPYPIRLSGSPTMAP